MAMEMYPLARGWPWKCRSGTVAALALAIMGGVLAPSAGYAQSADDRVMRIDYYPNGLVSSTTLPDGSFTSYVYDAAQRLTDVVDAEGNSIHYTLDNAGNRIKEEVKGEDGTLRRTLSRVYNQLGELEAAKDSASNSTNFTYDVNGNRDVTTDALGRKSDNDYDSLGRLTKTIQDLGGIGATTEFKYDAQDNLIEVKDPKALTTRYQYNAFGDLIRLESPDTGVTAYSYDNAGNQTSVLDARGELVSFTYDALSRMTSASYADASLNVTYIYDTVAADCEAFETFPIGRLSLMSDSSGETRYCYDRLGNMTRKVQVTDGQSFTLRYSYTKAGQVSTMRYPDGVQVDYVRDGLGRVTELGLTPSSGARQILLTGASYHPFGPVAKWTFGNGRTLSRTLDLDYRPKTILSTGAGAGGLNLGFGWDAIGNLSRVHTSGLEHPPSVILGYDGLNRLIAFRDGASGVPIESYSYDASGNRTSLTSATGTQSYVYPTDSHRLSAVNAIVRTYDAAGNTVSIGGTEREFGYDAAGRMSRVERNNSVLMEFSFDGFGRRVARTSGGSSYRTVFDERGRRVGEYASDGTALRQFVWLGSIPVGVISNGELSYIEADYLGAPREVIDPSRDVAIWSWSLTSEAFGNSPPNEDADLDGIPFALDMRFPGQNVESASSVVSNGAREFDAETGRFLQSDPAGLSAGVATYGYAYGSPFVYFDADGLSARTWWRLINPGGAPGGGQTSDPYGGPTVDDVANAISRALDRDRPKGMTPAQESVYDKVCKGNDDKCAALKASLNRMIDDAYGKLNRMWMDQVLYQHAFEKRNPAATGGHRTTWVGHQRDLINLIGKIQDGLSLGRLMGCDVSREEQRAIGLFVPNKPWE